MDLFKTSKTFSVCELKGAVLLEKIPFEYSAKNPVSANNSPRRLRHIMLTYSQFVYHGF